eukprot:SM000140S00585  [mRNA]  locus=s140:57009:59759:- [translate_table: standard]
MPVPMGRRYCWEFGSLLVMEDPPQSLLGILRRDPFPAELLGSTTRERADLGFTALALLNRRLRLLAAHATSPTSNNLTHGVRVIAKSSLQLERTSMVGSVYEYKVRIVNESAAEPVRLLGRRWTITDFAGVTQEVAGPGVVGRQPLLSAGMDFEYSSYATIGSDRGTMQGSYQMVATVSGEAFDVAVGPFAFIPPVAAAP